MRNAIIGVVVGLIAGGRIGALVLAPMQTAPNQNNKRRLHLLLRPSPHRDQNRSIGKWEAHFPANSCSSAQVG